VIRITKRIAGAHGVLEAGQQIDIDPATETAWVAAGVAEYVGAPKPEKRDVETAEAPAPAETAEAPKPKPRKRRAKKD